MKIAIRGGHNYKSTGASGIINEVVEDRKVKDAVIKYLKAEGHTIIDCTSPDSCVTQNSDLAYGVNKANSSKADLFISIHFNNAYKQYTGHIGHECLIYGTGGQAEVVSKRIVSKVCNLTKLKNRGVKVRPELYENRKTTMPSVIVEVCFVEATEDVSLYKKIGPDAVGKAIAEAILNKEITEQKPIRRVIADGFNMGAYSEIENILNKVKYAIDQNHSEIKIELVK